MTSPRHFGYFLALGMFWGLSPSLYKHLAALGVPLSHTIAITGLGVGAILFLIAGLRNDTWWISGGVIRYGAICAFLMNVPFGLNLYLAGSVPPTELAIIITLAPFANYVVALVTGWEIATRRRLLAIAAGAASTIVLILTREGTLQGNISWDLIAALAIPLLYCVYNTYAARGWPRGTNPLQAGAIESLCSGLFAIPAMVWIATTAGDFGPTAASYAILVAACFMWVVERISYFILISEKGAVYTVQATYLSTPAAVFFAAIFFGGGQDAWLWLSLALLMVALYLNNTGRTVTAQPA